MAAADEVHGIKKDAYAALTADDLISKLIKDKAAPTVEEYTALIETIELAELDERFNFADNATNDAFLQLKSDGATLPNILDCANAIIANDSAKVRAYYYSKLGGVFFDESTAYYAPIKAKILAETEAIAIAYTFHSTALMVAPFFIICRLKPWKKPFVFICIILVLLIIFLPGLWTTIIETLESMGQDKLAEDYADFEKLRAGVNFLRIVVAAFPVIVSYIYYPIIRHENKHIDFFINMAVLNLLFMLCGERLTVLARFAMYFNLALPVLVPEFAKIFKRNTRGFARALIWCVYFVHMIVLLPNDSHLIPYRFLFGHI